jgi:hypothetical protein
MPPLVPDARELADATLTFLARHEDALQSGVPGRALEACESLHAGLCQTLAQQVSAVHNAVSTRSAPEPAAVPEFLRGLDEARRDASAREAWALASLRKRMAETEGVLLHLRLTLQKGSADGPALGPYMRRLHAETLAALRCLAALRECLLDWADAVAGAAPRIERHPRDALRAAREALAAGVPEAVAPLLLAALPRDAPARADVARVLALGVDDPVLAWRLVDLVEHAVNAAGMTGASERAWASAGR